MKVENAMKHRINRVTFKKVMDPLLVGVALTDVQLSMAAETVYDYFRENGAGYIIEDLVLKTMYTGAESGALKKVKSWLETREGVALSHSDMGNLVHRIGW